MIRVARPHEARSILIAIGIAAILSRGTERLSNLLGEAHPTLRSSQRQRASRWTHGQTEWR
jgi:hypothetical protein